MPDKVYCRDCVHISGNPEPPPGLVCIMPAPLETIPETFYAPAHTVRGAGSKWDPSEKNRNNDCPDYSAKRQMDEGVTLQPIDASMLGKAKAWLAGLLRESGGRLEVKEISARGQQDGLANQTILRAKDDLGIRSVKEMGAGGSWYWVLPKGLL
jgi:hypothetical protein